MRFLLVVPRIVNNIGDWYWFPTGMAYISSSLKTAGFDVKVINLNHIIGKPYDILKQNIEKYHIDGVMTGGLTGQYGAIREVTESVKKINDNIITIVGGCIITSAPEHAMTAIKYADYGVIGEGEIICCNLCAELESVGNVEAVAGIIYKHQNRYTMTKGQVQPVDIDELPFPDYAGMGLDQLLNTVPNFVGMCEERTTTIITSRSCPFKCTFCFHPSGQTYRQRSMDNVFREIDLLVENFNVKYISFQDELFGYDRERLAEFCKRIKKYHVKWWAQFRVNHISKDMLVMLKDANCATISLGVESADNRILKSMNKGITIEQSEKALDMIYASGIGIQGNLIFGDKAETNETAKKSIEWWKKHKHYQLQLSMIVTYPGTPLYNEAISRGVISDPVAFIRQSCPVVKLSKMTDSQYAWLLGQILSLPRELQDTPKNCHVVDIDWGNAHITLEGLCVSCGYPNSWKDLLLFITSSLICAQCGRRHSAPLVEAVVLKVAENVEKLIHRYGKVVFWGINSYLYEFINKLSEKIDEHVRENIHFVDDSEVRQGVELFGATIKSPAIIETYDIECIVVAVLQFFASLKKTINDSFPKVNTILSIVDLL
jgi:radical SAM superfamily enzyme YgiQ (UPF0313 family)